MRSDRRVGKLDGRLAGREGREGGRAGRDRGHIPRPAASSSGVRLPPVRESGSSGMAAMVVVGRSDPCGSLGYR